MLYYLFHSGVGQYTNVLAFVRVISVSSDGALLNCGLVKGSDRQVCSSARSRNRHTHVNSASQIYDTILHADIFVFFYMYYEFGKCSIIFLQLWKYGVGCANR